MTPTTPDGKIVASMWHRGRKEFVPWADYEIMRRAGVSMDQCQDAARNGFIETYVKSGSDMPRIYRITELGIKAAHYFLHAPKEGK